MDPTVAIIAGLIGASFTMLIAARYRPPTDLSDEEYQPPRWRQIRVDTLKLKLDPQAK